MRDKIAVCRSVRLSYRVLVTWVSFDKKISSEKIALGCGKHFPWFDVVNNGQRGFSPGRDLSCFALRINLMSRPLFV